jgi:hypothetical protein
LFVCLFSPPPLLSTLGTEMKLFLFSCLCIVLGPRLWWLLALAFSSAGSEPRESSCGYGEEE